MAVASRGGDGPPTPGGVARRAASPAWGCGGTGPGPRKQYTATSFAEPLTRVFDDVLRPEHDLDVTPLGESRYLIESVSYRQRVPDRLEARLYPPVLAAAEPGGEWSRGSPKGGCTGTWRTASPACSWPSSSWRSPVSAARPSSPCWRRSRRWCSLVVGAPCVTGLMRQVRARLEGRAGAGVGQPWRDLRKLLAQGARPGAEGTSAVFVAAPVVLLATAGARRRWCRSSPRSAAGGLSDLFAVVAMLLLGTVALALAGLDTGTAFGGMGRAAR